MWSVSCVRKWFLALSREKRIRASLIGINLVLTLFIFSEWALFNSVDVNLDPSSANSTSAAPQVEVTPSFALPAELEFKDFVNRPIFSSDRRPHDGPSKSDPVLVQEPQGPLEVKLSGVFISDKRRVAVVVDQDGKTRRVRPKELVDGWEVSAIERDHIIVKQGENEETLFIAKHEDSSQSTASTTGTETLGGVPDNGAAIQDPMANPRNPMAPPKSLKGNNEATPEQATLRPAERAALEGSSTSEAEGSAGREVLVPTPTVNEE